MFLSIQMASIQGAGRSISDSALHMLWPLMSDVLRLDAEVFKAIPSMPYSLPAALLVVFMAGFFQSLSQIVVLFINQVQPLRFVLSLLISALLFVVGYGFWALSTWTLLGVVFNSPLSFLEMLRTLGFSYAPLAVFGVFVMLPYFGGGVFVVLSIWTLLAVVVGLENLTEMSRWDAFGSAVLGWVVLQLSQKTIGQPIASVGQWITNWVAGEELITNRRRLAQELYAGLRSQRASLDRLDPDRWQQRSRPQQRPQGKLQETLKGETPTAPLRRKIGRERRHDVQASRKSKEKLRQSLSQAILSQSLRDARERLRAENRERDR